MSKRIKKLMISNFQSHKNTVIEFDEKLNVIIGESDKGKSSIVRALVWVLYNYPSGDSFIRYGENQASVHVIFNDNTEIIRTRGKKENSYDLIENGINISHLEGFGTGSVDVVTDFHKMREFDLLGDKISLNICKQLDSPFFLSESSSTKATIIGKLAEVEVVDLAIKNVATEIRETKAIEREMKRQLKSVRDEIKELPQIPKMKKDLKFLQIELEKIEASAITCKNIEQKNKELIEKTIELENLKKLCIDEDEINLFVNKCNLSEELSNKITLLEGLKTNIDNAVSRISSLSFLSEIPNDEMNKLIDSLDLIINIDIPKLDKVTELSNKVSELLSEYEKRKVLSTVYVDVDKVMLNLDKLDGFIAKINKLQELKNTLHGLEDRKIKGEKIITTLEERYTSSTAKLEELLGEEGICPVCNSKIDLKIINM